jgi:hypothetical protein
VLLGPLFRDAGRLYAAVNANVVEGVAFGAQQPVSPRMLGADDKVKRWKELWFSNVTVQVNP